MMQVLRMRKICHWLPVFLFLFTFITLAADNQVSSTARLSQVTDSLQAGNWTGALHLAESWVAVHPQAPIMSFIDDVARYVALKPKHPTRTVYDFPYSNANASSRIRSWLDSLVVSYPENENYLILAGMYYFKAQHEVDKSLELYNRALTIQPDNVFTLSFAGALYGAKNQLSDAESVSLKAIKLDPKCAQAYDNLGMVYMTRGDRSKAEEYFKKATSFPTADAMSWYNLGSLYAVQGRLQEGKAALLKSISFAPNLMASHWNLASIYYQLGQTSDCVRECKKVIALDPNSMQGEKAANNLRQMGR
jgi:tetratricopeptide (TPR) repeat protein